MSIAVVEKSFSVLEVLARQGRALTLADLADECRLPKPTAFRVLKCLRD
jgi:DNA-binding IclR family transcriptional regulator